MLRPRLPWTQRPFISRGGKCKSSSHVKVKVTRAERLNERYAAVTREIKLFENYFSRRRRASEIILFQRVETCLKSVQNYFTGLLHLMNIFQRVQMLLK